MKRCMVANDAANNKDTLRRSAMRHRVVIGRTRAILQVEAGAVRLVGISD